MSLELSQVTKKHAGDFGPLSRWYFLRVTRCLLREREKNVETVLCNKTNKQCKNFDFSKNKIPCITFFKDLLYKVYYMFYKNYFFFNFSHSSTNTYMQKLPKILPHIDIITETSKKTELYSLKLTCLIFGTVTRSPFPVDIVKISAPRCISFACSLRRCI